MPKLFHYDNIDSTNQECLRLLAAGHPAPFAVVADRQFMGRGRHGRQWQSDSGNLFYSIALPVEKPLRECGQISFITALCVRQSILASANSPIAMEFKWPNDLLCGGKKVGGILIEHAAQKGNRQLLIAGIGVNLMLSPLQTAFPASSIYQESGQSIDRNELADQIGQRILNALDDWQKSGFAAYRQEWLKSAWRLGQKITISDQKAADGTALCGIFLDLTPDGALLLQDDEGQTRTILSGMVA